MEKFKPTIIAKEFVNSISDSLISKQPIYFDKAVASSTILSDDQAKTNNFSSSQRVSQDVIGVVTGYKNVDTNTLVANVKINNKKLTSDVRVSTIIIYGKYNGTDILVSTSRLNNPELLPAFDNEKGTPVTIELAVYIQVNNIENAPVQFNEAGLATNVDLAKVDKSTVHNTGDEVIDGVKTFNKPINGTADLTIRSLWDGYDLNNLKKTGVYTGNNVKTVQSNQKENFTLVVSTGGDGNTVKQTKIVFSGDGSNKTFVRYFNKTWSEFKTVPTDDSILVHNTGDETINGSKTFNSNVDVNGTTHLHGDTVTEKLDVNQKSFFHADTLFYNGAHVNWGLGVDGTLNVLGQTVLKDLDVYGAANIKNGLSVVNGIDVKNGGMTTSKGIFVGSGGINTKDGIDSYGLTYAHKDLTVDGTTKLNGDLTVKEQIIAPNGLRGKSDSSGWADNAGHADSSGTLDHSADIDITGAQVKGSFFANAGGFWTTGNTEIRKNLSVLGDMVSHKIDVNGPLLVHGDVQVDGHLNGTNTREVVHMGIGDAVFWRFGHTVYMYFEGYYGDTGYTFPWGYMSGFNVPAGYRPAEQTLVTVCNDWKTTHANINLGGNLQATETAYNRNTNIEIQGIWQTNDDFRI